MIHKKCDTEMLALKDRTGRITGHQCPKCPGVRITYLETSGTQPDQAPERVPSLFRVPVERARTDDAHEPVERQPAKTRDPIRCKWAPCGKLFVPLAANAKYHDNACRNASLAARILAKKKTTQVRNMDAAFSGANA